MAESGWNMQAERLFEFHTSGMIGSSLKLIERNRLNIELGWRGLWFPGADQLSFISGPQISFGFSFCGGKEIDPISW